MSKNTTTTEDTEITKTLLNEPPEVTKAIGEYITKRDVARLITRGFRPDQVKRWAIFHGAEAGEAEKAIAKAQKEQERLKEERKKHPDAVFQGKKVELFPGLTEDETKKRLESLADKEREQAAGVVHLIPAIREIIQTIATKGEEGKTFLTEAGEDFLSLLAPAYMPKWDINTILRKIDKEQDTRETISIAIYGLKHVVGMEASEKARIKTDTFENAENPEKANETALFQNVIDSMRKTLETVLITFGERQSQLYAEIKAETQDIEKTLNSYYDSAYFQAYTIAKEIPTISPEITRLSLMYFFATSKIAPDEIAPENTVIIEESDAYYLRSIVKRLARFFSTYAPDITPTESNRFYTTFIDFIYNEITSKNPEVKGIITNPGHAAISIDAENRYIPNLRKYESIFPGYDGEIAERFLLACAPYYEKSHRIGTEDAAVIIRSPELIERIIGKQSGIKTITVDNVENKEWTQGEKNQLWRGQISDTIYALPKIFEPITADATKGRYPLLVLWGIHEEDDTVEIVSPWLLKRNEKIHNDAKRNRKNEEINPFITVIIDITKETPFVRELTAAILSYAQSGQKYNNRQFVPARLIREECPRLYKAISEKPTSSEKSLLLKRTFQRFYKIIEMPQKVALYDYFLPITKDKNGNEITPAIKPHFIMIDKKTGGVYRPTEKIHNVKRKNKKTGEETHIQIKEIAPPYPTYKNWDNVIIKFCHGGKNPNYIKPL